MFGYIVHRVLIMIPTLIAISFIVFVIIQLPPGNYLTTYVAELESQGEKVSQDKIDFLKEQYGFDKPWYRAVRALGRPACCRAISAIRSNTTCRCRGGGRPAVADLHRVVRRPSCSPGSSSFPIGVYSATHQYSWGDYGLTFLGFLGLATPNFLLALVLLYLAKIWFGTSVGGLMDPQYVNQPWTLGKIGSILAHLWIPVIVIGTVGHRRR